MTHSDESSGRERPSLPQTRGERPLATDAPFAADRLTVLAHELHNLIDGSMRCLLLALRSIEDAHPPEDTPLDVARRRIETARVALERMCDVVHTATTGVTSAIGSPTYARGDAVTLADALRHAVDVASPLAGEHGVTIELDVDEWCERSPAGPLYTIVLNGLQNALESLAGVRRAGRVRVRARVERLQGRSMARVEIQDNGPGLPSGFNTERLFDYGVSTKRGGMGIGLALCRDIVREAGGTIELRRGVEPSGAVLVVACPLPPDAGEAVGG